MTLNKINILILLILSSCQAVKHNRSMPFKISDAVYYSWFVNEHERGTNFELTLTNLEGKIQFEGIIFKSMKIPLSTVIREDTVLLKGVVPGPESVLPDLSELSTKANQLIFIYNGKPSSVKIGNIRRVEMKYYKPK